MILMEMDIAVTVITQVEEVATLVMEKEHVQDAMDLVKFRL